MQLVQLVVELVEFKERFWERILELTSSTSSTFIYCKFYDKFQQVVYILAAAHSDPAIGRSRDHVDLLSNISGNGNRNVTVMSFHARPWHLILTCTLMP